MILVAGAAVGIVALKDVYEDHARRHQRGFWIHPYVGAFLVVSAGLMLIFRIRRPRPTFRRIATQPGAVACFAMVAFTSAAMVANSIPLVFYTRPDLWSSSYYWSVTFLEAPQTQSALGVVVCWTLLASGRRWRTEPGWIDGIGRALGWAWILWGLSGYILVLIAEHLLSLILPIPGTNPF